MEKVNFLVIGAGAIGLAIGNELSANYEDIVIVEQEETFGRHTSSRNSEVIHSGIYYPPNSLKAKLCVEGNSMLYEFCDENSIPYKKTGKLVVANSENDVNYLHWLIKNGEANNVKELELINAENIRFLEPGIIAQQALFVKSTGIFDTHFFMKKLEETFQQNEGFAVYKMRVETIEKKGDFYQVYFSNGEIWQTKWLINTAGLFCEKIAKMIGINTEQEHLKIHYCKGEYYKLRNPINISKLVYPVPDSSGIFLGIHLTLNLNGEIRFGPNAYYVNELSYQFDENYKEEFLKAIEQYLPIKAEDLHPDDCGIRPKLQGKSDQFRDFYIQEESKRGLPKFINLMGIESPGLTASLAIGKYVKKMVEMCG